MYGHFVQRDGAGHPASGCKRIPNDRLLEPADALPQDDVPLREETVPIHDIAVEFDSKYRVIKVTDQPDGRDLPLEKTANGLRVIVPRLDVHTLIVADLAQ